MSGASDAVWIVEELLDEIIDRIISRDLRKEFNEKKTHEMSEVKQAIDFVKMMDEDMKDLLRRCFSMKDSGNTETIVIEKTDEGMKNVNRKDIVTEKKEEKLQEYKTMGFNWKEVEPIFKG
jgi:HD superfamily phosphohydrolase